MIHVKVHKTGDDFVITIPTEVAEALALEDGQTVTVELKTTDGRAVSQAKLREIFEASWKDNQDGYRYLAGR
jgi:antitoxin component of MazEF toxin-antitoxin module